MQYHLSHTTNTCRVAGLVHCSRCNVQPDGSQKRNWEGPPISSTPLQRHETRRDTSPRYRQPAEPPGTLLLCTALYCIKRPLVVVHVTRRIAGSSQFQHANTSTNITGCVLHCAAAVSLLHRPFFYNPTVLNRLLMTPAPKVTYLNYYCTTHTHPSSSSVAGSLSPTLHTT